MGWSVKGPVTLCCPPPHMPSLMAQILLPHSSTKRPECLSLRSSRSCFGLVFANKLWLFIDNQPTLRFKPNFPSVATLIESESSGCVGDQRVPTILPPGSGGRIETKSRVSVERSLLTRQSLIPKSPRDLHPHYSPLLTLCPFARSRGRQNATSLRPPLHSALVAAPIVDGVLFK